MPDRIRPGTARARLTVDVLRMPWVTHSLGFAVAATALVAAGSSTALGQSPAAQTEEPSRPSASSAADEDTSRDRRREPPGTIVSSLSLFDHGLHERYEANSRSGVVAVRRRDEMHRLSRVRDDGRATGVGERECAMGSARKMATADDARCCIDGVCGCAQLCVAALRRHTSRRRPRSSRARHRWRERVLASITMVTDRRRRENAGEECERRVFRRHSRPADSCQERNDPRRRSTRHSSSVDHRCVSEASFAGRAAFGRRGLRCRCED